MCQSMVDIQSVIAEIRQGKKDGKKKKETTWQWPALFHRVAIKNRQLHRLLHGENSSYRQHYSGGWQLGKFWSPIQFAASTYAVSTYRLAKLPGNLPRLASLYVRENGEWVSRFVTAHQHIIPRERWAVKKIIERWHHDNPHVANFKPCFLDQDHSTSEGVQSCKECNPFLSTIGW